MTLVENNVKLVDLATPGKKIEYAGRVCYKSQDKISDGSDERFIKGIIKRGHTSVLEHERKMFAIPIGNFKDFYGLNEQKYLNITSDEKYVFVSGNIRAWYELLKDNNSDSAYALKNFLHRDYPYIFEVNESEDPLDFGLLYSLEAEEVCSDLSKHKSYTFEIVGTRSFTHQIVRHRTLSFSQESQRYCNYNMDRFGNSIKFVKSEIPNGAIELLKTIEKSYFNLIESGIKPEDARQILPNCTASTIVVTGTVEDWKKFLKLRVDSHAQKEIRNIAETIMHYLRLTKKDIGIGEKDE